MNKKKDRRRFKRLRLSKSSGAKHSFFKRLVKSLKKLPGRFAYPYIFDKRQRFAVQTFILTAGLLAIQLVWDDYRFYLVGMLAIISYALTVWSLNEDIKKVEWFLLFILPVSYTVAMSLFYFLLPERWVSRLLTMAVFSIGTYAILLIENIYNVAAIRSIQLLRVAQSIGLLVTLVIIFLFSGIVYSFKMSYLSNMVILASVTFLLSLQSLWCVKLETALTKKLILYSLLISLVIGQEALALSFWPLGNTSYSLLLAASYYSLTGIIQQYLNERLFLNVIREYLIVFFFTLFLTFIITRWS